MMRHPMDGPVHERKKFARQLGRIVAESDLATAGIDCDTANNGEAREVETMDCGHVDGSVRCRGHIKFLQRNK